MAWAPSAARRGALWSTSAQRVRAKITLVGLTAHCPATDFVELLGATRAEEFDAAWCRSCWYAIENGGIYEEFSGFELDEKTARVLQRRIES